MQVAKIATEVPQPFRVPHPLRLRYDWAERAWIDRDRPHRYIVRDGKWRVEYVDWLSGFERG